ncbi:MAG: aldo/keto reductase [Capsulimonadales bacterium]|nr:aldo/keto reductase [Capsulimonadales bacterium]
MEYRTLGRTGLSVSVMGLGCGGHSRLGLSQQRGEENAIGIVRQALAAGINFIDTAEAYGTETVVGQALASSDTPRDAVVLATKVSVDRRGGEGKRTADELCEAAEAGLRRLRTDYVDVLQLHGVTADEYDYCRTELVPALERLRDQGKIRFLGITEAFIPDPGHVMLRRAIRDDCWDVMMVGFNLLNPSARVRVLPTTLAKGIGVLDMFAVRRALSNPDALKELMRELVERGQVDPEAFDADDPLGFLLSEADSLPDAAYRFCRDEPGVHVVLSGTGNPEHLAANLRSLSRPPLSPALLERLRTLFARVDSVSGN